MFSEAVLAEAGGLWDGAALSDLEDWIGLDIPRAVENVGVWPGLWCRGIRSAMWIDSVPI